MQVRALLLEDDAASSVLGVVLMVAVTIILAAVVGTFVLGIGQELTEERPQVAFDYGFDVDDDDTVNSSVLILHGGGDELEKSTLEVTVDGTTAYDGGSAGSGYYVTTDWPDRIQAGDRLEVEDDQTQIDGGETMRIIWTSEDNSAIIAEETVE